VLRGDCRSGDVAWGELILRGRGLKRGYTRVASVTDGPPTGAGLVVRLAAAFFVSLAVVTLTLVVFFPALLAVAPACLVFTAGQLAPRRRARVTLEDGKQFVADVTLKELKMLRSMAR
jgi:hypothetical protein